MKRIFISSVVALAVVLGSTAVAQAAFTTYMNVGSTGASVTELQTWLIANGFDIVAISSGAASKGYFGQQTKAAVIKYQKSVGLPSFGYVGPMTIAKLNGTGGVLAVAPACNPVYYNCTPVTGAVPAGTVVATEGVVTPGTDGSITLSLSSFASNTTIKKGETKDMVAVKLQATAAPVAVTRFDVRLDKRPWLYFDTLTLKDSNGVVIATKNLSSSADATEVTVGSDYIVRFEGINAVVVPGTDRTFVVSGHVLSTTDKLTSDVSVIVSVQNSGIRTINGKGYTDSIGLGAGFTAGTTGRTVTLSSSGSTANILGKLSLTSPEARFQTISASGETTGVVLGKFEFKSENRSSTINTLTFTLKNNQANGAAVTLLGWPTLIKRLYISDGVKTVQVDSVATSSVFSNLTFELPQDAWKTLTLTADIADADDLSGLTSVIAASSTITVNATNIVGIDSNFTTVTASGGNAIVSKDITFATTSASVSNLTAGATLVDNGTSKANKATLTFSFKLNNTGSADLYIAKAPNTALATSSTVAAAASSTLTQALTTTSPTNTADTSTAYIIPANTSRSFYYTGLLDNTATAGANHSTSITKIYFDDDTTGLQKFFIDFGLEALATPAVNIGI